MYSKFTSMAQTGDIIYIARYLVSGAEASSLYLEVTSVEGTEVNCIAQNAATLEGLLCVFHAERSHGDGLNNEQVGQNGECRGGISLVGQVGRPPLASLLTPPRIAPTPVIPSPSHHATTSFRPCVCVLCVRT